MSRLRAISHNPLSKLNLFSFNLDTLFILNRLGNHNSLNPLSPLSFRAISFICRNFPSKLSPLSPLNLFNFKLGTLFILNRFSNLSNLSKLR